MAQAKIKVFKAMGYIWRIVISNPKEVCLTMLLVVQLSLIVIGNLTLTDKNLDFDSAMLLKHVITMWEERTLTIPEWSYITTLEWDCTTFLALPLYGVTGNIYLSCALSNIVLMFLLVSALFFLFQGQSRLYPLLSANLICIPYRIGQLDYFNMLFFVGAQYIIKVTIPLMLIGVLISFENKEAGKRKIRLFFIICYLFLLFLSSASSSVYVAICGVLPVWVAYAGYKFLKWEKVHLKTGVLLGSSLLCIISGGNKSYDCRGVKGSRHDLL